MVSHAAQIQALLARERADEARWARLAVDAPAAEDQRPEPQPADDGASRQDDASATT